MRLVFFGTGTFAVPALRRISSHVVLVVTQPDRPKGRGNQVQSTPVKQVAEELGIPVQTPEKARAPEFVDQIRSLESDALIVASYGQILSQALLDSAQRGGINLHGSLLPKYRGAAPIQRAILNGDQETGVTLMQMDKGMDTGDIIEMQRLTIDPDETYGELQDRLAELSAHMIEAFLPALESGSYRLEPQNPSQATIAPKVEKAEAEVHFSGAAAAEYNRFRAFTPAPGAYAKTGRGLLKISSARLSQSSGTPGEILSNSEGCEIACDKGSLVLLEVQPEGKKRVSGRELLNGWRLKPGDSIL